MTINRTKNTSNKSFKKLIWEINERTLSSRSFDRYRGRGKKYGKYADILVLPCFIFMIAYRTPTGS